MGMMTILVFTALLIVLVILIAGLLAMGRRGKEAARLSNKLMRWRIAAQFLAIGLIVILVILEGR
ncbi:MAG: twin transmembrane helix small protein [Proteobacteria bacterium]|nr:twin transmembrane helix small protein [Pseudomonadota bacterium]